MPFSRYSSSTNLNWEWFFKKCKYTFFSSRTFIFVSVWVTHTIEVFPFLNSLLLYWVVYQAKQKEEEEKTFRHRRRPPRLCLGNETNQKKSHLILSRLHAGVDLFTPSPSFFYAFLSLSIWNAHWELRERRVYMSLLYHCYFVSFPHSVSLGVPTCGETGNTKGKEKNTWNRCPVLHLFFFFLNVRQGNQVS